MHPTKLSFSCLFLTFFLNIGPNKLGDGAQKRNIGQVRPCMTALPEDSCFVLSTGAQVQA